MISSEPSIAFGEAWWSIKVVVPFAAGGSTDVIARVIAEARDRALQSNRYVDLSPVWHHDLLFGGCEANLPNPQQDLTWIHGANHERTIVVRDRNEARADKNLHRGHSLARHAIHHPSTDGPRCRNRDRPGYTYNP